MLNRHKMITLVAFAVFLGMGYCNNAPAQISDAQVWDVQVPNDYAGGARMSEGFFFGAEGLLWTLPSPKSALVGNPDITGENAYSITWTVRNNSALKNQDDASDDDEDDDEDDEDDEDDQQNVNVAEPNPWEYDEGDYDYASDKYGPISGVQYTKQRSDWNTNLLSSHLHLGQRYTFGFMNKHQGWDCSIFFIEGSDPYSGESVQVGFEDANNMDGLGSNYLKGVFHGVGREENWEDSTWKNGSLYVDRMLVEFDQARMWSDINTWGVELNYLRRSHGTRLGMFEGGLGVRYMKWDEEFGFWGGSNTKRGDGTIYTPNFMDDTTISTNADNSLVGPQLGLKWSRQTGRFGMEVVGKFTAAYNAQKVTCRSLIGSKGQANAIWGPDSIYESSEDGDGDDEFNRKTTVYQSGLGEGKGGHDRESFHEFSPIVELGVKMNISVTRNIDMSFGWSGIYAGNIARPASMTDYSLDSGSNGALSVLAEGNTNDVFMHGFTFGVIMNR